jgi:hypothetical protein
MSLLFNNFSVFPSSRTPAPTSYPKNLHPHEPCLRCFSPHHSSGDCPQWGQLSNFSYGQINTNFFNLRFESQSNSYTPNWNNHSDVSWYAHATGNCALQSDELHHPEYPLFNTHSSMPSSYNHPPQEPLVQHFSTANIDDFEERVNQLMATRHDHTQPPHTYAPHQSCSFYYHPSHLDDYPFISHYVIEANKFALEHAQNTIFGSEEVVEEIFCEPSLEDPLEERFDQIGGDLDLDKLLNHADTFSEPSLEDPLGEHFDKIECNLDLDKFLKQAVMFREPSLEDPLEESFAQFEFDLDLDMVHEQAKALLDPTPEMRAENGDKDRSKLSPRQFQIGPMSRK